MSDESPFQTSPEAASPVAEISDGVLRFSEGLFHERLRWLARAVSVADVLPVRPIEAASARAAVLELNNLAGEPLADWIDGEVGQGLRLTPRGRRLSVALLVLKQNQERLLSHFGVEFADDVRLLDRVVVRTSARNQFVARVQSVVEGSIQDRVILEVAGRRMIGALITRNSADTLGIRAGVEVVALIKASAIRVVDSEDGGSAAYGENRLRGSVIGVQTDNERAELVVDLGSGLTAIAVATQRAKHPYGIGDSVWLSFDPAAVIIGVVA